MKDLEWLLFGAVGTICVIVLHITLSLALEAIRGVM